MKKISVIIPCYNVEAYIERCMDSVLAQTIGVENIEMILVDDASTDGTLAHLLHYESMYPEHTIVIPCKENRRQGTARNLGLSYATGEFIAWVDADDWLEPDMYMSMYQKALEYGCDVVACKAMRDDGTGQAVRHPENNHFVEIHTDQEVSDNIAYRFWGTGEIVTRLCRRDFLLDNDIYFAENVCYEDALWQSLVYVYARRIYVMDEELYHYFLNPESTVLKKNEQRHLEMLDVGVMIWREYEARGLLAGYKEALELDFIEIFYFTGLKMLAQRFDNPPYEAFCYMLETVRELVPDWEKNPYITNNIIPFFQILLALTRKQPSEGEFLQIMDMMREADF
ncbi:MAG: glycosyltransferase family 2 protein [Lachnospiraceae bacterium]|nr:glycosyltransferase family 2 protein [Lachnospiraceae bacterium]